MTLLTLAKTGGRAIRRWGRASSAALPRPAAATVIAGAWFAAVLATILWVWGLNSKMLISPDEALNRFAAALLAEKGRPFFALPFPDPEDLAHPRHWVSVGDRALPAYAPVAIYSYGLLLRLRALGLLLVAALPASAAAAFALGTAKFLPDNRRWLSVLAPILGFPALYWLIRPWVNMSALLICVCWSFFFWASWRQSGNSRNLTAAIFGVGAAAAVRPDYAAYLFIVTLLFGIAASPPQWRRITVLVFSAGASAVGLNLFLNWLVTGHPLLAAYQIVAAREEHASGPVGPLGLLRQLVWPMGVPTRAMELDFLVKYWLKMGTVVGLTIAQLALVPLWLEKPRLVRALHALAVAVMLCFMLSHMDDQVNGASERLGMVHHSMPRYWTPVYLLAALPPILFLGQCKRRAVFVVGAALACALAASNFYDLYKGETQSLLKLRQFADRWSSVTQVLADKIPSDAMVYSAGHDKVLWSRWRIGTISDPEPTAMSIRRAVDANLNVFVFEPRLPRSQYLALDRALRSRHLAIIPIDRRGLYHVARREP